jgi:hypothetical protein
MRIVQWRDYGSCTAGRGCIMAAVSDTVSDLPRIAAGDHAVSVSPTRGCWRGVVRLLRRAIILFATTILMDQDYDQERYFNPSISFICGSSDFQ